MKNLLLITSMCVLLAATSVFAGNNAGLSFNKDAIQVTADVELSDGLFLNAKVGGSIDDNEVGMTYEAGLMIDAYNLKVAKSVNVDFLPMVSYAYDGESLKGFKYALRNNWNIKNFFKDYQILTEIGVQTGEYEETYDDILKGKDDDNFVFNLLFVRKF